MKTMLMPLAGLLALSAPALAQDADRYRLEKSGAGFVRMDTQSGAMSYCEDGSGRLVCQPAEDAQGAGETSRLEARIADLERRLAALEAKPAAVEGGLPPDEELERTLSFMERFFRRFIGVVKEFEDEAPADPAPQGGTPQRT